jgi:hypothetical protein
MAMSYRRYQLTNFRLSAQTHLDLGTTNPPDGRKVVLHEQVICFVVEAPLADNEVCSAVLDHPNHIRKLLLLVLPEMAVLLHARDLELVLGLRTRGLERARQDGELGVLYRMRHLRMREVLVDEHAVDERGVSERAADFAVDFDEVERHVAAFEICNGEHSIDSDLGELLVLLRDTDYG